MHPTTAVPVEFLYNTHEKNQEAGLNAAVAYGLEKKWQLVSIIWAKEEDDEHYFTITYNPE